MAPAGALLKTSRELVSSLSSYGTSLIVNDRPDVAALAGAAGVHVGQEDLEPEQARVVVGGEQWGGISSPNLEPFRRPPAASADYISGRPLSAPTSQTHPDPLVG